jgi:hypothetical protein
MSLPSFLFWRAFLLISLSKQIIKRRDSAVVPFLKYDSDEMFIDKSEFEKSPIKVFFGRPNFDSLFLASAGEGVQKVHVYSTTSPGLNKVIFDCTKKISKATGVKFEHIYESTS